MNCLRSLSRLTSLRDEFDDLTDANCFKRTDYNWLCYMCHTGWLLIYSLSSYRKRCIVCICLCVRSFSFILLSTVQTAVTFFVLLPCRSLSLWTVHRSLSHSLVYYVAHSQLNDVITTTFHTAYNIHTAAIHGSRIASSKFQLGKN